MLPSGHFLFFMVVRISFTMVSVVFCVVSIWQILFLSCSCRASVRLVSRISAARFSQSLVFL